MESNNKTFNSDPVKRNNTDMNKEDQAQKRNLTMSNVKELNESFQPGEQSGKSEFSTILSELDFYLLGEGKHWESYNKLGAHLREVNGVAGVNFIVWAPNASNVSVIGDFNQWNGSAHPMHKHEPSGLWEIFIPGVKEGDLYKYEVSNGLWTTRRADPYGFYAEIPPGTASVVVGLNHYQWSDDLWMNQRNQNDTSWLNKPISIYEIHAGSWKRSDDDPEKFLNWRELADRLIPYVKDVGYTHIELLPVAEHPLPASWGYQVIGYYSITSRYGSPEDFMYFVDSCHKNGLGVIIDWVPAHFPKDEHGLRMFDGTALYEHADPRRGEHRDWGTLIFNYGRNEVCNYLISNAVFWIEKYHIDGLRVDAVASMLYLDYSRAENDWIPNEYGGRENIEAIKFLRLLNETVHIRNQGILTIAEESTSWPAVSRPAYTGGLGFSMKWNMGWMNDTLSFFKKDPIYRKYSHDRITFSIMYAFSENFVLPISHDEVVHGKGTIISNAPGDLWQKFANARLLYSYLWTHPGKKLLFMGCEFGQWSEWKFDHELDWNLLEYPDTHGGLKNCVHDLNRIYKEEKALHELDFDSNGFQWIDCQNWEESTFTFMRKAKDPSNYLVVVANFTPIPRRQRIGVPEMIDFEEIFCSDAPCYGGSGTGNGRVSAMNIGANMQSCSIEIMIPPLGLSIFKPVRK